MIIEKQDSKLKALSSQGGVKMSVKRCKACTKAMSDNEILVKKCCYCSHIF